MFKNPFGIQRVLKYLCPKYADALVARGEIKIGTLYDFRREEAWGQQRGDVGEGTAALAVEVQEPRVLHAGNVPLHVRPAFEMLGNVAISPGAKLILQPQHPDAWVYCATAAFDFHVMTQFGGACVEIDVMPFFTAVTEVLERPDEVGVISAYGASIGPCHYNGRSFSFEVEVPLAFLKDSSYEAQQEVRAVWLSRRMPIRPKVLTCPGVVGHCRRIA